MKNVITLCYLILPFVISEQMVQYKDALEIIINSNEYSSYTSNPRKYHVSDELIVFSKMGKMFKEQLSENDIELSDYDIVNNDKKKNTIDKTLLDLNKKKCAKLKIYFTEEQGGIFFAELIKEKKRNVNYDNRTHFGISYMYMFKNNQGKIKLLKVQKINYN
ncbi:hypothetical protein [Winogradskyella sp.]|uniref:hypothetical protein n=1 Tax=Winogradskyella sp. TaxID=1883156 RepID=UPI003BAA39EF